MKILGVVAQAGRPILGRGDRGAPRPPAAWRFMEHGHGNAEVQWADLRRRPRPVDSGVLAQGERSSRSIVGLFVGVRPLNSLNSGRA